MPKPLYFKQPALFQRAVLHWYDEHGRKELPWQTNPTPYRVWVSEVMLQQTQVTTATPYFQRWMKSFPDIFALAKASEDEVMSIWQGLGYYTRARNLRKGAQFVVDQHDGLFPSEPEDLRTIPGVGPYTAGAIMSFAYDQPCAVVDGNIKRLFCRLFGIAGPPNRSDVNRKIWSYAESLLPQANGRHYAQALLDLGATVCKAKKPECELCPLQEECFAYQQKRVSEFPNRKAKISKPVRQGTFLWIESAGQILLEKRRHHVWTGLWCLPETDTQPENPTLIAGEFCHHFTHYQLNASVIYAATKPSVGHLKWFNQAELESIGLPTPIRRFVAKHLKRIAA